jgi:hypothetical protein
MIVRAFEAMTLTVIDSAPARNIRRAGRLNHLNCRVIGILTPWPEEPAAAPRNRP